VGEPRFVVDRNVFSFVAMFFGKQTETATVLPIVKLIDSVMTMGLSPRQRGVVTGVVDDFNTPAPDRTLVMITRNWFPINITAITFCRFNLVGKDFID